jgi:hypothetical protein
MHVFLFFKTSIQSLASPFCHSPLVVLLAGDYYRQHLDWVDRDYEEASNLELVVVLVVNDVLSLLLLMLVVVVPTCFPNTMLRHRSIL